MEFNFGEIGADLRYKLLCSFVGPRSIAPASTRTRCASGRRATGPWHGCTATGT